MGPRPSSCVCYNVRKAARAITNAYEEALKPIDLRVTQLSILFTVNGRGPLTLGELAELLETDRTTMSRNLGPMIKSKLINVRPGKDKRSRIVSISMAGKKKLDQARPIWARVQTAIVEAVGEDKWTAMQLDLNAISRISVDAVKT